MTTDSLKHSVRQRFSQKADSYDQAAVVQKRMAHRLLEELAGLEKQPTTCLEIGCGTGYFTRLLLEEHPQASCTALDMAPGMIEKAQQHMGSLSGSCEFLLADAEEWVTRQRERSFDCIVSNACFQWFEHLDRTLMSLNRLLVPAGTLAFSTFGSNTFHELHSSFQAAYRQLGKQDAERHGLTFREAREVEQMMIAAGFQNVSVESFNEVLYYPSVRDFLYAIKSVGANTSQAKQGNSLGAKKLLLAMMDAYDQLYRTDRGIPVTYEVMIVRGECSEK